MHCAAMLLTTVAQTFSDFGRRRVLKHGQDEVLDDFGGQLRRDLVQVELTGQAVLRPSLGTCRFLRRG